MDSTTMTPGDMRTFKKGTGKAVVLAIGLWPEKKKGTRGIQIHITGTGTHTTVTNNESSERYHRTLFRDLRRVLLENNCWPYGDDGAETETK